MLITSELNAWSHRHHGLVSLAAWTSFGGSERSYYRAVREGRLTAVAPNVAALAGRTVGPLERIAAGIIAFGPGVAASHRSGTWLWGAEIEGAQPVDLTSTTRSRYTTVEGYVLHRPADLGIHAVLRRGVPTTSPTRTLLDLGGVAPDAVGRALDDFLVAGHVTERSLVAALARYRRRGRPGIATLTEAMANLDLSVPRSTLESVMATVFARARLDGWRAHEPVEGYEVDFCFPDQRVIVEVDGWEWHAARRSRWEDDRDRDLVLSALGWLVVRITWRMVTRRPGAVAARLRATLAHRSPIA